MSHQPTSLSVNLNKIALIRNSREGNYPDLVAHGRVCLDVGAQGLTVHPRPDQRHIRPQDLASLQELLQDYSEREFNVEGNPFAQAENGYPGFMALVKNHRPHQCTLVPDSSHQLTSDHGFDLQHAATTLEPIIKELQDLGIRVSLFVDPDPEQIERAKALGADRIELYTGPYALAHKTQNEDYKRLHERYRLAAQRARYFGLGINAGHDLNLENLKEFLLIPGIDEVSIGHALTVDALAMGMTEAVQRYLHLCRA